MQLHAPTMPAQPAVRGWATLRSLAEPLQCDMMPQQRAARNDVNGGGQLGLNEDLLRAGEGVEKGRRRGGEGVEKGWSHPLRGGLPTNPNRAAWFRFRHTPR